MEPFCGMELSNHVCFPKDDTLTTGDRQHDCKDSMRMSRFQSFQSPCDDGEHCSHFADN